MEQKKTISELYQECKLKQEMKQKEELLAQLAKDFFDVHPVRFGPPPIRTFHHKLY